MNEDDRRPHVLDYCLANSHPRNKWPWLVVGVALGAILFGLSFVVRPIGNVLVRASDPLMWLMCDLLPAPDPNNPESKLIYFPVAMGLTSMLLGIAGGALFGTVRWLRRKAHPPR